MLLSKKDAGAFFAAIQLNNEVFRRLSDSSFRQKHKINEQQALSIINNFNDNFIKVYGKYLPISQADIKNIEIQFK